MPSPLGSESYDVVRGFVRRVWVNRARLTLELKPPCDIIVCGAGSLGSVIARRLAENPGVSALVEAGGNDAAADVLAIHRWVGNEPSGAGASLPMTTRLGPACRRRKSLTAGGNGGGGGRAGSGSMITQADTVRVRSRAMREASESRLYQLG